MSAKQTLLALAILGSSVLLPRAASADENTGFGVGAESFLTSAYLPFGAAPGVATLTYDASVYRLSGMLTMVSFEDGYTYLGVGGRFYYPLHKRHDSDFSVGGGAFVLNTDPDTGESDTSLHLEMGIQIRAFLTTNVALTATGGFGIILAEEDGPEPDRSVFGTVGQLVGSLGISYFFY
jgi:hypothetical protein